MDTQQYKIDLMSKYSTIEQRMKSNGIKSKSGPPNPFSYCNEQMAISTVGTRILCCKLWFFKRLSSSYSCLFRYTETIFPAQPQSISQESPIPLSHHLATSIFPFWWHLLGGVYLLPCPYAILRLQGHISWLIITMLICLMKGPIPNLVFQKLGEMYGFRPSTEWSFFRNTLDQLFYPSNRFPFHLTC